MNTVSLEIVLRVVRDHGRGARAIVNGRYLELYPTAMALRVYTIPDGGMGFGDRVIADIAERSGIPPHFFRNPPY